MTTGQTKNQHSDSTSSAKPNTCKSLHTFYADGLSVLDYSRRGEGLDMYSGLMKGVNRIFKSTINWNSLQGAKSCIQVEQTIILNSSFQILVLTSHLPQWNLNKQGYVQKRVLCMYIFGPSPQAAY